MTPERREDERLSDVIYQLRALAPLVGTVARHDAEIAGLGEGAKRIERAMDDGRKELVTLITEVRDECRARDKERRWSKGQWVIIVAAVITSGGAVIAAVLSGSGAG